MSSGSAEDLSDENGVLRLGSGRSWFKCLEIKERRGLARRPLDARAASCPRPIQAARVRNPCGDNNPPKYYYSTEE